MERVSRGRVKTVRPWVAATAVLAAIGVVVLAVSLTGPSKAPARPRLIQAQHTVSQPRIVLPVHVSAAERAALPQSTTFTKTPKAPTDPAPFTSTPGMVVHPRRAQIVYAAPGGAPVAVLPRRELGEPTWVPVVQTSPGWERVLLPSKPNRSTGWIFTGGTNGSALSTEQSRYVIRIRVAARKLTLFRDGRPVRTWRVAVGMRRTPTPTGRTFVLAMLAPPHPTYSPLIIPLGFHSPTLNTFGGGPGTVGVHGWPDPSVFGRAVSHGCVRVPDAALRLLAKVSLGSIVMITG